MLADVGQCRAKFGRMRARFGRFRATAGRWWPISNQSWSKSVLSLEDVDTSLALLRKLSGTTWARHRYYLGTAWVLHLYCTDAVLSYWSCLRTGSPLVPHWCCTGIAQVVSWYALGTALVLR